MIPAHAIANRERPQNVCRTAGMACYESFTLNGLSTPPRSRNFGRVMTEVFALPPRAAGAETAALCYFRHANCCFSHRFTTSELCQLKLTTDNFHSDFLPTANCQLTT